MIKGIGIDIVEVEKIKTIISKWGDKFLNKCFTKNEILYCNNKSNPYIHYAGKFAAKEAVMKATGYSSSYKKIEILNEKDGKPNLFDNKNVMLSIAHTDKYAVAFAIFGNDE
jgi:holo-[acyl-carrier protein] synthase